MKALNIAPQFVISLLFLFMLSTSVYSTEVKTFPVITPPQLEGSTKVNAEQVIELIENKSDLVIIDSRMTPDRMHGGIENSVSLQDIDTTCPALTRHLATQSTPVVFYCNGEKCSRSARAVKIAISCGYNNIYWFRNGIEEWVAESLPLTLN
jgi:rhodanese-related sulfurtransferase